jgi:hypothetical protein
VLVQDFKECSHEIEHGFGVCGVGYPEVITEACTFPAGRPSFKADVVDVWGCSFMPVVCITAVPGLTEAGGFAISRSNRESQAEIRKTNYASS